MKIEETRQVVKVAVPGEVNSKRDEHVATLQATFDSYEIPFLIWKTCCANPDCPCREVVLDFVEREASSGDPIYFRVLLDVDTWKEVEPRTRTHLVQQVIDEFIRELPDETKDEFREMLEYRKAHARKAGTFTLPVEDVLSGKMVPYSEVFTDIGSVLEGGRGSSFTFTHDGVKYYIEDTYCPNPDCHCNSVQTVFLREDGNRVEEAFAITVSLKGKVEEVKVARVSKKEARHIHHAWLESDEELLAELRHRYAEIKDIGDRILEEEFADFDGEAPVQDKPAKKRKIGRNEPCPCGSGKKYKRCCLLTERA